VAEDAVVDPPVARLGFHDIAGLEQSEGRGTRSVGDRDGAAPPLRERSRTDHSIEHAEGVERR
jgi:hypothetical protein